MASKNPITVQTTSDLPDPVMVGKLRVIARKNGSTQVLQGAKIVASVKGNDADAMAHAVAQAELIANPQAPKAKATGKAAANPVKRCPGIGKAPAKVTAKAKPVPESSRHHVGDKAVAPWGTCSVCGRNRPLDSDGNVSHHRAPVAKLTAKPAAAAPKAQAKADPKPKAKRASKPKAQAAAK